MRDEQLSNVTGHGRKRWAEDLHEQIIQVGFRIFAQTRIHEYNDISLIVELNWGFDDEA